jgi:magnesium-transporting ATPase (P-type)
MRRQTIETACFTLLLASIAFAFAVWLWGLFRRSFGSTPALLWVILVGTALICAAIIATIEFQH